MSTADVLATQLLQLGMDTLASIGQRLERIEETVMATQAQIDALVGRIDTAVAAIRQDIADLKAANPAVDVSRLEASVGRLEGLDAENPTSEPTPLATRFWSPRRPQ